jgi:pullulanase
MTEHPFYSYLDNFDEITIIIPMKNYRDNNAYRLIGEDEAIELVVREKINLGGEVKLVCSFDAYIHLEKRYYVENEEGDQSELQTGKIVRTELFDNIYRSKKTDLGFTYQKDSTKFKIWSPVAKQVTLELVSPDGIQTMLDVPYTSSGVWRIVVEGDLERTRYRYHVYVNGKEQIVGDPYAVASDANGIYAYVIDKAKTVRPKHSLAFSGDPLDAIIYEASIRDFSTDPSVPFQHRGKYLAFTETGLKTKEGRPAGIDYLAELGITHVQIMPFFDFDGVDELDPDRFYNWGYNPKQYNVPEGWFASDPNDPYARINELKRMIDALHERNIGVIMDVVYNHVYDAFDFPFEKLIPGYAYHVDRQGIYTNHSGCKNDLATQRKMVRKLILDSVKYWVEEYGIDGFRFDLMGLIDTETMNEVRQELYDLSPRILVYGEGWKMHSSNQADRMAHMTNKQVLYTIGFFNDRFREIVKGKTFEATSPGFTTGGEVDMNALKHVILGSALNRHLFKYTSQSINYVECHDNMTFYDKALTMTKDIETIRKQSLLAASMVILSQGVPFLHSGQEFLRTKFGVENSYDAGDVINRLDWSSLDQYHENVEFLRKLIALRKSYGVFKLKSTTELTQSADVIALQSGSALYCLNNSVSFLIVFKPKPQTETIVVPEGYELFESSMKLKIKEHAYECSDIGVVIFLKRGAK